MDPKINHKCDANNPLMEELRTYETLHWDWKRKGLKPENAYHHVTHRFRAMWIHYSELPFIELLGNMPTQRYPDLVEFLLILFRADERPYVFQHSTQTFWTEDPDAPSALLTTGMSQFHELFRIAQRKILSAECGAAFWFSQQGAGDLKTPHQIAEWTLQWVLRLEDLRTSLFHENENPGLRLFEEPLPKGWASLVGRLLLHDLCIVDLGRPEKSKRVTHLE